MYMQSPESWFHLMATHYVVTQILFHLNQVGAIALLKDGGAMTVAQFSEALRLKPRESVVGRVGPEGDRANLFVAFS
jgi:hypothetical protein